MITTIIAAEAFTSPTGGVVAWALSERKTGAFTTTAYQVHKVEGPDPEDSEINRAITSEPGDEYSFHNWDEYVDSFLVEAAARKFMDREIKKHRRANPGLKRRGLITLALNPEQARKEQDPDQFDESDDSFAARRRKSRQLALGSAQARRQDAATTAQGPERDRSMPPGCPDQIDGEHLLWKPTLTVKGAKFWGARIQSAMIDSVHDYEVIARWGAFGNRPQEKVVGRYLKERSARITMFELRDKKLNNGYRSTTL